MAKEIGGEQAEDLTEEHFIEHSSLHLISTNMAESNDPFCCRPVNHHEVKDVLGDFNTRKATGYDGIQPRILKLIAEEVAPSLTWIFNTSIEQRTRLSDWKRGEWVPVYKRNNREEVKNCRPITILPTLDKLFEKLLGKQFTEYMDPKLSNSLTAYRKNNGWDTSLLRLVEKWNMDLDSRQVVRVLSSDMSKAFDSVSPPLLIKKLESYNFSGSAHNLLRSSSCHRQNRVKLGSVNSQ